MTKDFTQTCYNGYLWISQLAALKYYNNQFIYESVHGSIPIRFVVIFGTVVEKKPLGEHGLLLTIDDGTGVITCKLGSNAFEEFQATAQLECSSLLSTTISSEESTLLDDTVFNDRTLQTEEIRALKEARLMSLHSLWRDTIEIFSLNYDSFDVWDSVCICGRLYSYFSINQIYINSIRRISLEEELVLMWQKLEDGFLQAKVPEKPPRRSGLITFDNIVDNARLQVKFVDKIEMPALQFEFFAPSTPLLNTLITYDTASQDDTGLASDEDLFL